MPLLIFLQNNGTSASDEEDTFFPSEIHTSSFCPGLLRWFAGFSGPNGVARQDSELVLHPGTQLCDGSSQLVAGHHIRN